MSDPKPQGGMRFNANKMRFNLIPLDAKIELARVYTMGAIKYDDDNWLKGMSWKAMIDCMERHWTLWQAGLHRDPDTGCHHLAQVAWNALGLLVYELRGLGTDDRTKLPLNENFDWVAGPAAALGLGLSPEALEVLRTKYTKLREEHKAKMAAEAPTPVAPERLRTNGVTVIMDGRLAQESFQDNEGRRVDMFIEQRPEWPENLQGIEAGDILMVFDDKDKLLFNETITGPLVRGAWPSVKLNTMWFDLGFRARLVRTTLPFSPWHMSRTIFSYHKRPLTGMSPEERKDVLERYTTDGLDFLTKFPGVTVDMDLAKQVLECAQETGFIKVP